MSIEEIVNEKELTQILWACYEYWDNESDPVEKRVVCYDWVVKEFKSRFDRGFHESELIKLADYGILSAVDKSRGGNRVYYTLNNPSEIREKLLIWGLFD